MTDPKGLKILSATPLAQPVGPGLLTPESTLPIAPQCSTRKASLCDNSVTAATITDVRYAKQVSAGAPMAQKDLRRTYSKSDGCILRRAIGRSCRRANSSTSALRARATGCSWSSIAITMIR